MERKKRAATLSGLFLGVVFLGLVLINALGFMTNVRADLTKNERFTLAKGSARLVNEGLRENMSVKLYVTRGLPKVDLFVNDLIRLMEEYQEASGGNLTFQVIEPKSDEQRQEAKDAGLQELALGEGSETGDQATIAQGYMGIVFEYGSESDAIEALVPGSSDQGLEFQITNKIREIRDRAEDTYPRVGVVKKEGLSLGDQNLIASGGGRQGPSMRQVVEQYFPFYKFQDVDLEGGEASVDPELDGVIVMQAQEDWSDKELARIDEFLMRGDKSLLVVAGAVNLKAADATMKATLGTKGLEKLTSAYGIGIHKDVLFDLTTQMRLPVQTQAGGASWITAPGVMQLQHEDDADEDEQTLDQSFAGFFRLEQLAFPYPSSLETFPEKQPGAELKVVARTSEDAYAKTGETVDLSLQAVDAFKPAGEQQQFPIAVSVEGTLESAVAVSEELSAEAVEIPAQSKAPSRVLVISSPLFFANPFAHAGNPPPMPPQMAMMGQMGGDKMLQTIAQPYAQQYLTVAVLAFKNLLDWMTGDQDLLAVSAKLLGEPNLSYTDVGEPDLSPEDSEEVVKEKMEEYREGRKELQQRVQWALTLVPPLLFIVLGVIRWQRREGRRTKIKI